LRQATGADYTFLYHLHRATLKDYVTQTWGWDEEVQATMFKERFDPARYQIVVVEGRDVGALVMEQHTDALVLANIYILPEYQGHGLGTAVIKAILEQAGREKVPVTLRVLKVNPARHLYERLGFLITGETETHYLMSTLPT
jgi:ribosomal protein S18 acetylase RimI-like enzyme